jgi:lipopolysaccharide/colanic/teichoic acid biosynthesis glycosyltransferase
MRRIIDLLVSVLCLIIFSPLTLLIAVLIRLDSQGSVLYTPRMVGWHGKIFSLYRFRTMRQAKELTRVGRFIRNYSLDHLPMLINLLKGDLTLVGPRPMEVETVDLDDPIWQRYVQVKPGLFNYAVLKLGKLWTPLRASNPSLNQELELEYLQKRSAAFDWQVLVQSLHALLTSRGNIKVRAEPQTDVQDKIQ